MFKEEIWANLKFFLFNSRRKQESLFFVILNFIHQFQMQFSELIVDCLILAFLHDILLRFLVVCLRIPAIAVHQFR